MLVVVYEGNPSDPLDQTMRVVRASSFEEAADKCPHAIFMQELETSRNQDMPDIRKLKRGMPVWSF